jgi:magnesium-transporting ATPase (P-type)
MLTPTPEQPDKVTVYLKGAPEVVVPACAYFMSSSNDAGFDQDEKDQVFKVVDDMAAEPL